MQSGYVNRIAASLLIASFWGGAIAIVPVTGRAQTDNKPAAKKVPVDKDAKPTATPSRSALGTKEDPSQIGKRNINSGTGDRFFGWLGGSREKEMQIGRQLALEVEQQGKMVEDPIVTEYINRVGQNIVLHSDAKVPFTI